jgi:UDP-glucose 4-epimerase
MQMGDIYRNAFAIFHLAWDTTPATSAGQPSLELSANLLPSLRLLEFLEHECSAHLIYVSSGGTVYGRGQGKATAEVEQLSPISYYGAGKGSLELFLRAYESGSENRVTILRPSNIYGPGQYSKRHFGVVPALMMAAMRKQSFRLMGSASSRRDYLYIDDFVSACQMVVAEGVNDRSDTLVLNVASGVPVTLDFLIETVEKVVGDSISIETLPNRSIDLRDNILDIGQILKTKWSPCYSLEEGIRQTWSWFMQSNQS